MYRKYVIFSSIYRALDSMLVSMVLLQLYPLPTAYIHFACLFYIRTCINIASFKNKFAKLIHLLIIEVHRHIVVYIKTKFCVSKGFQPSAGSPYKNVNIYIQIYTLSISMSKAQCRDSHIAQEIVSIFIPKQILSKIQQVYDRHGVPARFD